MIRTTIGALAIATAALVWGSASWARADTPTPAPTPQVTDDIELVVNDAYTTGDVASISIRNDGDIAYRVPIQPECLPEFKDTTGRAIGVEAHCDLPGYSSDTLDPGESLVLLSNWPLTECIDVGFSCFADRPLATGDYSISGSLDSVDGLHRAVFSKTIHITGPQFTSDVAVTLSDVVSGDVHSSTIRLRNDGQREYRYAPSPQCSLRFHKPDGYLFSIPIVGTSPCDHEDTISPGESVTVLTGWNRDECVEFGPGSTCTKAVPLPPGTYTVKGALWSADKQAYAEFSNTIAIQAIPTPTPGVPSPTLGGFPKSGGPTGQERPWRMAVNWLEYAGAMLIAMGAGLVAAGLRLESTRRRAG
ncbi:MAG TPA: hypothetical protein VLS25_02225, partial [Dehalococcoidia bacterium]|nr:hypothetical protein [Dehalococcoidia bacterium]